MGRGYLKEMAAGIEANKSAVLAEARELASEIDDIIGFSVPETGPLSNADSYMPDFMELLASGIRSNSSDVISAVTELASGMA